MVRHKNRYVIVEINEQNRSKDDPLVLNPASLYNSIQLKMQQLHGDFGVAAIRAGFTAKYCNAHTRIAVIRIRHGPHKLVVSCLPLINAIEDKKVEMSTLYTGATIRQCFKFILRYQQAKFDQFCAGLKTDEEKAAMKVALLNVNTVLQIS